jgi:glycerol-3-phosphate acyltransferase PlsX
MISHYVQQEFRRSLLTKGAGLLAAPVLRRIHNKLDPRGYNGASLVGLRGVVIKSHGGADIYAFATAIKEAISEFRKNVPQLISEQLQLLLTQKEAV